MSTIYSFNFQTSFEHWKSLPAVQYSDLCNQCDIFNLYIEMLAQLYVASKCKIRPDDATDIKFGALQSTNRLALMGLLSTVIV